MRQEFPDVTVDRIKSVVKSESSIEKAFKVLTAASQTRRQDPSYRPLKRRRLDDLGLHSFPPALVQVVQEELAKARGASTETSADHHHLANLSGKLVECGCCFTDVDVLKVTHCSGPEPHYFCYECTSMNAKTDIGNAKCRPSCMDGSGCTASFAEHQLRL